MYKKNFRWPESNFILGVDGCDQATDMFSKAHGRLYHVIEGTGYTGRILTGYRANADVSNWCFQYGDECHDTLTTTPIGLFIDHNLDWKPEAGDFDCGKEQVADAINAGLRAQMANIPDVPLNANDCLVFDFGELKIVLEIFLCHFFQKKIFLKNKFDGFFKIMCEALEKGHYMRNVSNKDIVSKMTRLRI